MLLCLLQQDTSYKMHDAFHKGSNDTPGFYDSRIPPQHIDTTGLFSHDNDPISTRFDNRFKDIHVRHFSDGEDQMHQSSNLSTIGSPTPEHKFEKEMSESSSRNSEAGGGNFDWNKANTDRFVHSPCYKELGFDPNKDPQVQEQMYRECESAKSEGNVRYDVMITAVLGGIIGLVIFGLKQRES